MSLPSCVVEEDEDDEIKMREQVEEEAEQGKEGGGER